MIKWVAGTLVVLAVGGAAAVHYYVYRPQQQALEATRQQLVDAEREKAAQRARIADLQSIRDQLERSSSELHQQVAQKESELATLRGTQDELLLGLKKEIADRQIQVERIRDQIRVDMVDEILFDSGEATLKPGGVAVLKKVGAVLAKVKDRPITVQGHTDNVPIRGALTKRFPTNWELSSARATNVARFLQEQAGLDPTRLAAAAFSEYKPKASNDTEEGRHANRRIEILLGSLITPQSTQPPEPAQAAQPAQPAQPTQPTQPAQPTQPPQP